MKVPESDMQSFFAARTALPDPKQYSDDYCYIWTGNVSPPFQVHVFLPQPRSARLFIFHRVEVTGREIKSQWICAESHFQELVYDLRYQMMQVIEGLFLD